jgi:hypothetical protein
MVATVRCMSAIESAYLSTKAGTAVKGEAACSLIAPWYGYGAQRIGFDCLLEHERDLSADRARAS